MMLVKVPLTIRVNFYKLLDEVKESLNCVNFVESQTITNNIEINGTVECVATREYFEDDFGIDYNYNLEISENMIEEMIMKNLNMVDASFTFSVDIDYDKIKVVK